MTLALNALVCGTAAAASVTLVAVSPFGVPLSACTVRQFRDLATEPQPHSNYSDRFRGLHATDVPSGDYEAEVRCENGVAAGRVAVRWEQEFAVVSESGRMMHSDHVIPQLTVRLVKPVPGGESWWITMRSLYRDRVDTAAFDGRDGHGTDTRSRWR